MGGLNVKKLLAAVLLLAGLAVPQSSASGAPNSSEPRPSSDTSQGTGGQPPAEPQSRTLSDEALTQAQELRRSFGLRSDRGYVQETF